MSLERMSKQAISEMLEEAEFMARQAEVMIEIEAELAAEEDLKIFKWWME